MTVLTIRPNVSAAIGWSRRESATYATALSGGGTGSGNPSAGSLAGGDQLSGGIYYLSQTQMEFPLTSLPAGAVVSDVTIEWTTTTFNVSGGGGQHVLGFTGGTVSTTTFVNQTSALALTEYGSFGSTGYHTGNTTYQLSLNAAARAAVEANAGGAIGILWCSDRFLTGTAPTGNQQYYMYSDDDGTSGRRPALIITYTTETLVTITGIEATASPGSVTVTGDASVAVSGQSVTASQGAVTVSLDTTVDVTGIAATSSQGSVTVTGDASVALTGVGATASPGAVTAADQMDVLVTGVEATATFGTVDVTGDASVSATGISATASAGSPTVTGDATVDVSGIGATASQGTVTATDSILVTVTGLAAMTGRGSVTVATGAGVALTGRSLTASVGTPTVTTGARVGVTGLEMQAIFGVIPGIWGESSTGSPGAWTEIAPGSGTWTEIVPGSGSWTPVDTGLP